MPHFWLEDSLEVVGIISYVRRTPLSNAYFILKIQGFLLIYLRIILSERGINVDGTAILHSGDVLKTPKFPIVNCVKDFYPSLRLLGTKLKCYRWSQRWDSWNEKSFLIKTLDWSYKIASHFYPMFNYQDF